MLGVQARTDMRRASLISEIYSESAGPTGGNVPIGGNAPIGGDLERLQKIARQNVAAQSKKPGEDKDKAKGGLEQAGISKQTLASHPAFRPKRITKSGLSKLSKILLMVYLHDLFRFILLFSLFGIHIKILKERFRVIQR